MKKVRIKYKHGDEEIIEFDTFTCSESYYRSLQAEIEVFDDDYPKYLKSKSSKVYVKLIDEHNNLYFRHTWAGFAIDNNGATNEAYPLEEFKGCSRQEFDNEYKEAVKKLNEITKL